MAAMDKLVCKSPKLVVITVLKDIPLTCNEQGKIPAPAAYSRPQQCLSLGSSNAHSPTSTSILWPLVDICVLLHLI